MEIKKLGLHLSKDARLLMKELQKKHMGDPKEIEKEIEDAYTAGKITKDDYDKIMEMLKEGIGVSEIDALTVEEKITAVLKLLIEIREILHRRGG